MPAQVAAAGEASGKYVLPPSDQELVFMGERCRDDQTLRDYGVCEPWIVQVMTSTRRYHVTCGRMTGSRLMPAPCQCGLVWSPRF